MLNADFLSYISKTLNAKILKPKPLSGGDINAVYLLEGIEKKLVIKINDAQRFPGMFLQEKLGLEALRKTNVIDVPKPIGTGIFNEESYLILEYKTLGKKDKRFAEIFGEQLAALHTNTQDQFGFQDDNYIGSLPQYNNKEKTAAEFYINQRLQPQVELAQKNGYTFQNIDRFYEKVKTLIPNEPPALIHGDLWGGNYLVNEKGLPCLIDPAVAYAPREMDLALMQLFGGFDTSVFKSYHASFALENGWEQRIKLWQLYYVLVHVNLFGGHYYASAKAILKLYI